VDHVSRSKQKENPRVFAQLDPARRGKTPCTSKIRSPQGRVSRTRQDQPGEFCNRYMEYAKTNKRSWLRDEQLLKPLKEFFRIERKLADITPPEIEGYKLWRRKQVSGATANRELALLKHMFNLAIDWDLYLGSNPLRKVKYFQEINTGFRVLKPDEETRLLRNATPAISGHCPLCPEYGKPHRRDFLLQWQHVDLDQGMINSFSHKTQKVRIVRSTRRCAGFWSLETGQEERLCLLQPENRGNRLLISMQIGTRLQEGRDRRSDVAHYAAHLCIAPPRTRCRHHDSQRVARTLDGDRYDALHAFQSRFEGGCRGKTGKHCYKSATPCTKMQQQGSAV